MYTVISGIPRSHAEYLVDSVNPVPRDIWHILLVPSLQINSSGYHPIKGQTRLDGVELEKCGGEHGIR